MMSPTTRGIGISFFMISGRGWTRQGEGDTGSPFGLPVLAGYSGSLQSLVLGRNGSASRQTPLRVLSTGEFMSLLRS
jgi:hypothetical protein